MVEAVKGIQVNEYIHIITINNSIFPYSQKNSTYFSNEKNNKGREREREKDDKLNNRTAITTKYYITGAIRAK